MYKWSLEVVKELLKDSRVNPSHNNEAIIGTSKNGHLEVIKELLKDPRTTPPIEILIQNNLSEYFSKKSILWFNEEIEYLITN